MADPSTTRVVGFGYGEQPGSRRAMDVITGDMVKSGVKPADAEKKARDLARDWDRRNSR